MSPGSPTCREASNVASIRSGVLPFPTRSAIRVPSTTSPRSAPSAKIANGSLIQSRIAPAPLFQPFLNWESAEAHVNGGRGENRRRRDFPLFAHIGGGGAVGGAANNTAAVAGPKVTIGTPSGIAIFFSLPPL